MRDKFRNSIGFVACVALLSAAPSLFAQDDQPGATASKEDLSAGGANWGTTSDIIYNVGADDFSVGSFGWTNAYLAGSKEILPGLDSSALSISGPIHLQAGALIKSITVFYYDNNTTTDPNGVLRSASTTGTSTTIQTITFPAGFSGGNNSFTVTLPAPGVTVDNFTNHYSVGFNLAHSATTTEYHSMYRARITYRLQVPPGPAVASFADVPTSDGRFKFVEALVSSGLTAGCGGGNYCPDAPVTRGQIAVFLASALGMHFPN